MELNNTMLKKCITKALRANFKNTKVYKDKEARPMLPAFFVRYISVSQEPKGLDFYEQSYLVEVRYRAKDTSDIDVLETLGEKVVDLLSAIKDGNFMLHARNVDYEITEGVVVVVANYVINRKRLTADSPPYMETLEEIKEVL